MGEPLRSGDLDAVSSQLRRSARDIVEVAHRCECGLPDVVTTAPRLSDGTPFPTSCYLTCPRLTGWISTLEAEGVMREMQDRLATDTELAARYRAAHYDYLARRARLGHVAEIEGVSAGGMPDRVKCLHALVAHALAAGPGTNPFGDEALELLATRGRRRTTACVGAGVANRRVAAIDCGTNSIRLLVADVDSGTGRLTEVDRRMEIVRLGEGVDRTGVLDDRALQRTLVALDGYAARIAELGAERARFVATSATRDAANRATFVDGVRQRLGIDPEVISGAEEARLSFAGATAGLLRLQAPVLVVDIGGGSTEFVMGVDAPDAAYSVDVGCVRMSERHFRHDPPLPAEVRAARDDIDAAIREAASVVPMRKAGTLVAVAGTATTVAAIALGLPAYDAAAIHGSTVGAADVHRIAEELLYRPRPVRAAMPVLHPGRVDVIAAGALVLSAIVSYADVAQIVVSEHDILDGLARSL